MNKKTVAAEIARKKVQFDKYKNKEWNIELGGLFRWNEVSELLSTGELLTNMTKDNIIIWVTPSEEFMKNEIKPLIKKHSLEELTRLAGWNV